MDHTMPGVNEPLPFIVDITDEPIPEMLAILDGVKAAWPARPGPTSQFPPSAPGITPATVCCPIACAPEPVIWSGSWKTLGFSMPYPHHWEYDYQSDGIGPTAAFEISAWADLNCDTTMSHWIIQGHVDADGHVVAGPIQKLVVE
jgi:hypothetical protein